MEQGLNNPGPLTIFLVFTAGLLTSLGPCSLSLLPITIAYVGGTGAWRKEPPSTPRWCQELMVTPHVPKHLANVPPRV